MKRTEAINGMEEECGDENSWLNDSVFKIIDKLKDLTVATFGNETEVSRLWGQLEEIL